MQHLLGAVLSDASQTSLFHQWRWRFQGAVPLPQYKFTGANMSSPQAKADPFQLVIVWLASHVLPYLSLWVGCRL